LQIKRIANVRTINRDPCDLITNFKLYIFHNLVVRPSSKKLPM
jgi:hypothetical protein